MAAPRSATIRRRSGRRCCTRRCSSSARTPRLAGYSSRAPDPTGFGGVVPGYSNEREIELLVEAGFTATEAIRIASLNGAQYLGRADHIGSIAPGKVADLLVVRGDPSSRIRDIENAEMVFKDGIGYDSERLFRAARGVVGLH